MTFPNGGEGGSPTWEKFPHFPVFFGGNVPKVAFGYVAIRAGKSDFPDFLTFQLSL